MIGTINVKCNAAHPEMALPAIYTFAGSPSSIRVLEVPKKIGKWKITSVKVSALYPDGTVELANCVLVAGVWVGTIAGNTTVGTTQNGFTIYADGIDENEQPVQGYILGKGDMSVLESDEELNPSTPTTFIKLLEEEREEPIEGDMWPEDGSYYIYQNGQVNPLGGGGEVTEEELTQKLALKADLSAVEELATSLSDYYTKSETSSVVELSTAFGFKQDKLSQQEDLALDSLVDERKTFVKFIDDTTATYDIYGIFKGDDWVQNASEIKFGTGVKAIDLNVFYNCTKLSKVQFPDTLEEIYWGAFDSCTGLTDIIIPDSVTYMMGNVFQNCTNLKTAIFGTGINTIDGNVFYGCTNLESVVFIGKSNAQIQSMANYPWSITDTSIIHGTATDLTPHQIAALNQSVDEYYTSIQFKNPVETNTYFWEGEITKQTMIDEGLYDGSWDYWKKHFDIVNLGETVTGIGARTFYSCEFSKMIIPRNIESIGLGTFFDTTGEVVFKDRTLAEVQAMTNYPWGLSISKIKTWNDASQEWTGENCLKVDGSNAMTGTLTTPLLKIGNTTINEQQLEQLLRLIN